MSDAKLVIEIEDDKGGGASSPPASPAGESPLAAPAGAAGATPVGRPPESSPAATGNHWDTLPEWKPAGEKPAGGPAGAATLPPMPGEDPVREPVDERKAEKERREAERQAQREAAAEIRERAAEARRQTAEFQREQREADADRKREAREAQAEARRLAREEEAERKRMTREEAATQKASQEKKAREEEAATKEFGRTTFAKRRFDDVGAIAGRAGEGASAIAKNETAGAVLGATDAAVAGLSKLGPYGMAAGAALQAVTAAGTAASDAVMSFVSRGRELSGLNGQLAGATAGADVRSLMADVREADRLGPQLAQMIEQQSKLEASFREILLPLKEWVLGILNDAISAGIPFMADTLETLNDILEGVTAGLGRSEKIDEAVRNIRRIMEEKDAGKDLLEDMMKQADSFMAPALPGPGRDRGAAARGGAMNIPLVKR